MSIIRLKSLTADRLREVLAYDPATGQFTWLVRPALCVQIGEIAGALHPLDGYRRIRVDGRLVRLGSFATVEAASAAYIAAKRELHKDGCTL